MSRLSRDGGISTGALVLVPLDMREDHENVRAGKPVNRSYLEQDSIRSTVGMY